MTLCIPFGRTRNFMVGPIPHRRKPVKNPTHEEVQKAAEEGKPCPGCGAVEYEECTHPRNIGGTCPFFDPHKDTHPDEA